MESAAAKPETIPDTRTTFASRARRERGILMKISVRVLTFLFSVVSVIVFLLVLPIAAQTQTATLAGIITDPRGASIAGAQIVVAQIPSAGEPLHSVSGNDGRYSLRLAPGRYRVTISHDSFTQIINEITVAPGEAREWNVRMTLEPLSSKVIVTSQALPLEADSSPAPVTIFTRQDIEQRVATSLPDLLANQPGIIRGRTAPEGGEASLFLDGGNSNHTKVLVDGTPVNQPGGLVDFSNFTVDNIDKVEIVHGAESALYGSDAMDGVIQIFTHRGTTATPEFTAYAEGGNFATGRGGGELSGLLRRFDYSAGFSDLETQGQGPNDSFRNRTISGNFGWQFSDTARVSLALRDNGSFTGTPGQTLFEPANLCVDLPSACEDNTRLHNFSANLHTEFTTGSRWRYQLNGTESYIRQFNFDPTFPSFFQYNRSSFVGESAYQIKGLAVTAGYEYEVENGSIVLHVRRNNQAGFLDARWQPIARLTLNAGARAEDNASFGTRVVPRAGASYALRIANGTFGDARLRASYGSGIVEPRFDQSFSTDPCFPGNPHLSPEQSRTVHAGIEQKLASDRLRVTVDYFDNRFRNMISFGFLSGPPPGCPLSEFNTFGAGTFFNTDLARSRGGNLSTEARPTRWLSALGNYTYDPTRVLTAPNAFDPSQIPGNRLLRRPVNSGNLMLNAAFKRMNWNVAGYFAGRRTDSDFLGLRLTSNPGYARFDLAGTYYLTHGVSFYGRVANLADKKYSDVLGYPALGREFRIGVKYTTRHE
jgi:vitamin B12 transporter